MQEVSKEILIPLDRPSMRSKKIIKHLEDIGSHINKDNPAHIAFYNSLATEVNLCLKLPTNSNGGFGAHDQVAANNKYICEFEVLLGEIATNYVEFVN